MQFHIPQLDLSQSTQSARSQFAALKQKLQLELVSPTDLRIAMQICFVLIQMIRL